MFTFNTGLPTSAVAIFACIAVSGSGHFVNSAKNATDQRVAQHLHLHVLLLPRCVFSLALCRLSLILASLEGRLCKS